MSPFWSILNKSMQEFPRTNNQQSHESMRKESWDSFLCPSDRLTAVHSAVSASMTRNPQTFAMRRKKLRSWNDGILRPCGIELWINFDSLPCMEKSPHIEPFSSSQSMKTSRTWQWDLSILKLAAGLWQLTESWHVPKLHQKHSKMAACSGGCMANPCWSGYQFQIDISRDSYFPLEKCGATKHFAPGDSAWRPAKRMRRRLEKWLAAQAVSAVREEYVIPSAPTLDTTLKPMV